MAGWPTKENKIHDLRNRLGISTKRLKCLQINLQHSRLATDNLVTIMDEEDMDVVSIQEPYNIGSTIGGIPRTNTVISAGEGKKRAAIVIKRKQLDAILITQISDEDATVVELKLGRVTLIVASMYFDTTD